MSSLEMILKRVLDNERLLRIIKADLFNISSSIIPLGRSQNIEILSQIPSMKTVCRTKRLNGTLPLGAGLQVASTCSIKRLRKRLAILPALLRTL
uniref:Uncharacterized protein n=1 Tax=bacterium enrichment culture clone 1(2010) TaxID=795322 RepID=D9CGI6_9BACT|nr:hypothetical protein pHB1_gp03 [bacterium enrichment culture clone 1(2010)]